MSKDAKVAHASGATSSHISPFNFLSTGEGERLTDLRFKEGNRKHEYDNPVYREANWLKAFNTRDVGFFRDRAGHAVEHIKDEMRGKDDPDPGGNLGGVGWFQDIAAFCLKHDPFLWGAVQGKWRIDDVALEEALHLGRTPLDEIFTGADSIELLKLGLTIVDASKAVKEQKRRRTK